MDQGHAGTEIFKQAYSNIFVGSPEMLHFTRDPSGSVTGFTVGAERAQGVRFQRCALAYR
jgi:hypothetical protein